MKKELFENIIKESVSAEGGAPDIDTIQQSAQNALENLYEVENAVYSALNARSKDEREGNLNLAISWIEDVQDSLNLILAEV